MAGRLQTPASPKNVKINAPVAGTPMFGCGTFPVPSPTRPQCQSMWLMLTLHAEHVQRLMDHDQETTNNCIQHYKSALRAIYDDVPLIAQISKSLSGPATAATINSNYLCLQCPIVMKEADMPTHGKQKSHRFCKAAKAPISLAAALC